MIDGATPNGDTGEWVAFVRDLTGRARVWPSPDAPLVVRAPDLEHAREILFTRGVPVGVDAVEASELATANPPRRSRKPTATPALPTLEDHHDVDD